MNELPQNVVWWIVGSVVTAVTLAIATAAIPPLSRLARRLPSGANQLGQYLWCWLCVLVSACYRKLRTLQILRERIERLEDSTSDIDPRLAEALRRIDDLEVQRIDLMYEAEKAKVIIRSQRWFLGQACNQSNDGLRINQYVDREVERFERHFVACMRNDQGPTPNPAQRWVDEYLPHIN